MFETVEQGRTVDSAAFGKLRDKKRIALIDVQQRLRNSEYSVVILLTGIKGAGALKTLNTLTHWMDPRWIGTNAYGPATEDERERPEYWRYWRDLPPVGTIGIYLHAWYKTPLERFCAGEIDVDSFSAQLARIERFERTLADDGVIVLKYWYHLSKAAQEQRLATLAADPLQQWRVADSDWQRLEQYDEFASAAEQAIRETTSASTPWHLIEGVDDNHRSLSTFDVFIDTVGRRIDKADKGKKAKSGKKKQKASDIISAPPPVLTENKASVLSTLDMDATVSKDLFLETLKVQEARLFQLQHEAQKKGFPTVLVFEGWDAAGKGGTIRHLTHALDARDYRVHPIAAPTDEERAHHYLWRFWRRLGRRGTVTVFDRSWYGRVLVEWVEGLIDEPSLLRSYPEINAFEQDLAEYGGLVLKFWLHVTPGEQLKRFKKRAKVPYKKWKLTDEDWRNRDKWDAYEAAVTAMVEKTSTAYAPWHLIPANCKRYARLRCVELLIQALEKRLHPA